MKRHKLTDGGGLYIVQKDETLYWHMKYHCLGKGKRIAFGTYPIVTLVRTRDKRDAAKNRWQMVKTTLRYFMDDTIERSLP